MAFMKRFIDHVDIRDYLVELDLPQHGSNRGYTSVDIVECFWHNISQRQTYSRKGKHLLAQQSRYAHARQYKRAAACTRKLRTLLGRTLRDIKRQLRLVPCESVLHSLLERAQRIHDQQRHDKKKLYSMHAPEVECISKGKAHKKYEFGVKVSIATTSKGGWHLAALACPGNPYDGHTLAATVDQLLSNLGDQAPQPQHIFTDQGYRGHDYQGGITVHVDKKRRSNISKSLWKWMKRRSAIEPGIGHLKAEHRMERNRLRGAEGDHHNALLSAAGMNFAKLLKHMAKL
jgi:IS5 family transposase